MIRFITNTKQIDLLLEIAKDLGIDAIEEPAIDTFGKRLHTHWAFSVISPQPLDLTKFWKRVEERNREQAKQRVRKSLTACTETIQKLVEENLISNTSTVAELLVVMGFYFETIVNIQSKRKEWASLLFDC